MTSFSDNDKRRILRRRILFLQKEEPTIKNIIFDIGQVLVTYDWEGYLREFGFSEEMNRTIA